MTPIEQENRQFKGKCFFNISEKEYDKKIFRAIKISHLISMFQTSTNTLVWPELWEDPYENIVFRSRTLRHSNVWLNV